MARSFTRAFVVAVVVAGATFGVVGVVAAQAPGFTRKELQRGDLSVPGREVVTVVAEFATGGAVGRHTHPGEEVTYVLDGGIVLEVDGQPPRELKSGETFFIPAGVVHAARNAAPGTSRLLANYVVEKGKPLATPVK